MTKQDQIFAQVLRHNKLVSEEMLKDAIADYDRSEAGRAGRAGMFAAYLVQSGAVTEATVKAINEALARQAKLRKLAEDASDLTASGIRSAAKAVSDRLPRQE